MFNVEQEIWVSRKFKIIIWIQLHGGGEKLPLYQIPKFVLDFYFSCKMISARYLIFFHKPIEFLVLLKSSVFRGIFNLFFDTRD